jgi:hypothetical protein
VGACDKLNLRRSYGNTAGLIGDSTSVTTWRNDQRVLQPGRSRVEVWELAGLAFIRITSPRPGDASLRPIGDARTS